VKAKGFTGFGRCKGVKWIGIGIGLLLVVAFGSQLPWQRVALGQNDFLQFYGGARLAGSGDLHSIEAMKQVQQEVAGIWLPAVQYVRPDYYAVLLKPLAWLPFLWAYWGFQVLNLGALLGFLWLWRERQELIWLGIVSIPLLVCFVNGQDVLLLTVMLGAAVWLEERGRGFVAGLLLALCTIKLHFLILIPLALLLGRRWKVIGGGVAGMAGLVSIGAFSEGWDWVLRYPSYLRRPEIHPESFQFVNLRGIALGLGTEVAVGVGLVVGVALLGLLWKGRNGPLRELMAISLLGGIVGSFHLGIHDCSLLLVVVAMARPGSALGVGAMLLSLPVAYWLLMLDGALGAVPALLLCGTIVWEFVKSFEPTAISSRLISLER
jgi:hypothetical protein